MTIGDRIKRRRELLGMSQDELAKKLGYKNRSSINKIELGERNLTQSKIKAIADALDTTPAYIMGWDDEEPDPEEVELNEYLEMLRTRPEMRMLLKTAKNATKEQVEANIQFIESLRGGKHGTD